ncbi:MAG: UDP-3-O-(3-hydroxymyristoyl)glucosamine N-acyltransferase [Bacteroidia bacterium]|nr:UDP-3-O-(3-hydroxymyristoyl)glucosamine N-acyltransferase [Bacteroidia bacterium]
MQFPASQIAALLEGQVEGNPDISVHTLTRIEEGVKGGLCFLEKMEYEKYLYDTLASVVIVNRDFKPARPVPSGCTLVRVADPRAAFSKLLEMYAKTRVPKAGIAASAVVAPSAQVGENVFIGDLTYIGENVRIGKNSRIYQGVMIADNVKIGDDCLLYPGTRIYADSVLGNHVTLHAGVVIGGDGFGFFPNAENNYSKILHLGNVIIEDHVEIGANTTIDRATLGSTLIRKGAKLDNLIQIGHNAEVGENTVIVAQTGIAGSTKIGKNCMIGGQVGIVGHLRIADGTKIAAQSGVTQNITEPNTTIQGSPAFSIGEYKRSYVHFRNFPEIAKRIKDLEGLLQELKSLQESK